jgi:hypothetical protein
VVLAFYCILAVIYVQLGLCLDAVVKQQFQHVPIHKLFYRASRIQLLVDVLLAGLIDRYLVPRDPVPKNVDWFTRVLPAYDESRLSLWQIENLPLPGQLGTVRAHDEYGAIAKAQPEIAMVPAKKVHRSKMGPTGFEPGFSPLGPRVLSPH